MAGVGDDGMGDEAAETWVFAYGSLMWNPGFPFAEARRAVLNGFHRAFCVYSVHYRGTALRPGLVLGLDRGGVCHGLAFRLAPETEAVALAYLRQRELIYGVYREARVLVDVAADVAAEPARAVWAVTYIAERAHPAYAGRLPMMRQAAFNRRSAGLGGTNLDYLISTRRHLREVGIIEAGLERLATVTGALAGCCHVQDGAARPTRALARAWSERPLASPRTVRDNRFGFRAKCAAGRAMRPNRTGER